jgi:DNA polymerase-3 subunit gamma/tau
MDKEKVQVEERALKYIAKTADGSMRDALSLLDQCIAFHFGEELTYDKVLDVLGAVDTEVFARLITLVREHNVNGCISLLEEVVMQGRELNQFVTDITWYLRNLLLAKTSDGDIEDVIDMSSDNLSRLKSECALMETEDIMRYIRIFSELSGQIKYANQKRILIELTLIKLCKPEMETTNDAVVARVKDLEEKIEKGVVLSTQNAIQSTQAETEKKTNPPIAMQAAIPDDIKRVVSNWAGIVAKSDQPLKSYLKNANLSLGGDNRLLIVCGDGIAYDYLSNEENRTFLENMISNMVGRTVAVQIQNLAVGARFEDNYVDIFKQINMDVEIEEDDEQ